MKKVGYGRYKAHHVIGVPIKMIPKVHKPQRHEKYLKSIIEMKPVSAP